MGMPKKSMKQKYEAIKADMIKRGGGFLEPEGWKKLKAIKQKLIYERYVERLEKKGFKQEKQTNRNGTVSELKKYFDLKESQLNRCAICDKFFGHNTKQIHWDHCHVTGIKRGLLCHNCNLGLGHFKDNIKFMKNAIEYLETHHVMTMLPDWILPDEFVVLPLEELTT